MQELYQESEECIHYNYIYDIYIYDINSVYIYFNVCILILYMYVLSNVQIGIHTKFHIKHHDRQEVRIVQMLTGTF